MTDPIPERRGTAGKAGCPRGDRPETRWRRQAPRPEPFRRHTWLTPGAPRLAHIFVGATLSATSVGITARVLRDLGATRSREAQIILGAAVIDDILGLVVLAVVGSAAVAAGSGGSDLSVLAVGGILLPWNERLCLAWRPHVGWVWP